jgi:hypothetical protein
MCSGPHESMASRRITPSVSLLVSSLHAFIHYLAPYSAKIHGLTVEQQKFAEAYFEKLGPIPKICIDFAQDPSPLYDYENHCQAMVKCLTYHSLQVRHFVIQGTVLDLIAESHTIFMIGRNEVDVLDKAYYLKPISANAEMQLMTTINGPQWLEKIDLYHTFQFLNGPKAIAGLVYESLGHTCIQKGITLGIKPTIKLSLNQQQTPFHSKTQSEEQVSNFLNQDDLPPETSIFFPPNPAIIYKDGLTSVKPNRLYILKARN